MTNKNQETAERLNTMRLSKKALRIIGATEINLMYELFGSMETAEEVESFIAENYKEEGEKTYQVELTWYKDERKEEISGCNIVFESTNREEAIAEYNRRVGTEGPKEEYGMWVDEDGIGAMYSPEYDMISGKFYTCSKESWILIDEFETKEEALRAVEQYEAEDLINEGEDSHGFYDVISMNSDGKRFSVY